MSNYRAVRRDISRQIGFDVAYLSAHDEAFHLDAPGLLFSFAGLLIMSYCTGFIEAATKDFKSLGEKSWARIRDKVLELGRTPLQQTVSQEQEAKEEEALLAFQEIFISIEREQPAEVSRYSYQARVEVISISKGNNFPEEKAQNIAMMVEQNILKSIERLN